MSFETAEEISRRTGMPFEALEGLLAGMAESEQLFPADPG